MSELLYAHEYYVAMGKVFLDYYILSDFVFAVIGTYHYKFLMLSCEMFWNKLNFITILSALWFYRCMDTILSHIINIRYGLLYVKRWKTTNQFSFLFSEVFQSIFWQIDRELECQVQTFYFTQQVNSKFLCQW